MRQAELRGPDGPEGLLALLVLDIPTLLELVDLGSKQRVVGICIVDKFLDLL